METAKRQKYPEKCRKKESTAHPKAKRCFPEGKEACYYSLFSTVVSTLPDNIAYVRIRVLFNRGASHPHALPIGRMYLPAFVCQHNYTRSSKKICRKNTILPDIPSASAFGESTPVTGHASFAKPKLTLAIWAAYLVLCLLPLNSTGLESRRHWVADPFYHHFSRNFSQSVAISVAVSAPI